MSLLSHVFRQNVFSLLAQASLFILSPIFVLVFSYILPQQEFGILATFISLILLLANLSDLGMSNAVAAFIGRSWFRKENTAGHTALYLSALRLVLCVLISIPLMLFSGQFSDTVFHSTAYSYIFLMLPLAFTAYSFAVFIASFYGAFNRYEFAAANSFVLNFLRIAVPVIFVLLFGATLWFIIMGVMLAALLSLAFNIILFALVFGKKMGFEKAPLGEINAFLLYSGASAILLPLFSNTDILLLNYFHNPQEAALYRAAQVVMAGLYTLMPVSAGLLYTLLVELEAKGMRDAGRKLFQKVLHYGGVVMIPLAALIFFASDKVVGIYKPEYASADVAFQIMALGAFFSYLGAMGSSMLLSKKDSRTPSLVLISAGALQLIINILLIPSRGFVGASLALALNTVLAGGVLFYFGTKKYGFHVEGMDIMKPLTISVVLGIVLWAVKGFFPGWLFLIPAAFYMLISYALLITGEDWELLRRALREVRLSS